MAQLFDPGHGHEPFRDARAGRAGLEHLSHEHFRTKRGPVFHRGRLDGSAGLLIIEQDPGTTTSGWVPIIATNPAQALAVDALVGSLDVEKKADVTVLRARAAEPDGSLLASCLRDAEGVWIDGQLLYGSAAAIETVRPKTCEQLLVQGRAKRVCTPVLPLVMTLGKQFSYLVPVGR